MTSKISSEAGNTYLPLTNVAEEQKKGVESSQAAPIFDDESTLNVPSLHVISAPLPPLIEEWRDDEGKTALHHAVSRLDVTEAKKLLQQRSNPNSKDNNGISILQTCLEVFLPKLANTENANPTGKQYEMIKLLANARADLGIQLRGYENIFDLAFGEKDFGLLIALQSFYDSYFCISDKNMKDFLERGDDTDLEFLLRNYPEVTTPSGFTLIQAFVERDRGDLLEKFKELKPELFTSNLRLSDLEMAYTKQRTSCLAVLKQHWANSDDPARLTISKELTEELFAKGTPQNRVETALLNLAQGSGQLACLPLLLQTGAELQAALEAARKKNNIAFLEIVQKDPSAYKVQRPAIHRAILEDDKSSLEKLLQPTHLKERDPFGNSALELAIRQNHLPAIKLLAPHFPQDASLLAFVGAHGSAQVAAFFYEGKLNVGETQQLLRSALVNGNQGLLSWLVQEPSAKLEKLPKHAELYKLLFQQCHAPIVKALLKKIGIGAEAFDERSGPALNTHLPLLMELWEDILPHAHVKNGCKQILALAIAHGDVKFVRALYEKVDVQRVLGDELITIQGQRFRPIAAAAFFGHAEIVAFFANQKAPLQNRRAPVDDILLLALCSNNPQTLQDLLQRYEAERKMPQFAGLYVHIRLQAKIRKMSQEQLSSVLHETIKLHKPFVSSQDRETIVQHLVALRHTSTYVLLTKFLSKDQSPHQIIDFFQKVSYFVSRLPAVCQVHCGKYSLKETNDWIVDQLFENTFQGINPLLFAQPNVLDDILSLLTTIKTNEDYGHLFVALQFAPRMSLVKEAFQAATFVANDAIKAPVALYKLPRDTHKELERLLDRPQIITREELETVLLGRNFSDNDISALVHYFCQKKIPNLYQEQRHWLAYGSVYRDRKLLAHYYQVLKHHQEHKELLPLALEAIRAVGMKRYHSGLTNKLAPLIQSIIETKPDEDLKVVALESLMAICGQEKMAELVQFLLKELAFAQKNQMHAYERALIRAFAMVGLRGEKEIEEVVAALSLCLKSESHDVQRDAVFSLSTIANEKGLLLALEAVKSTLWDKYIKGFGKNCKEHHGDLMTFKSRPEAIHDNREAMIKRILLQLVRLHENDQAFQEALQRTYQSYRLDPASLPDIQNVELSFTNVNRRDLRYFSLPLTYPSHTNLIRGLTTRKGSQGFKEAIRDAIRKGAGSSSLTSHDATFDCSTWSKIGHIFTSGDERLFFDSANGSLYFSNGNAGALFIVPAAYYNSEYCLGQARIEMDNNIINNVFYRGVPKRWIKAFYLPDSFKNDIQQLASDAPLEKVMKELSSDLFLGLSLKELGEFRFSLLAEEIDLTQPGCKTIPFIQKIHFLPEMDINGVATLQSVSTLLKSDGMSFAKEAEIKEETLKQAICLKLIEEKYSEKSPYLFMTQDRRLLELSDTAFRKQLAEFISMLPAQMQQEAQVGADLPSTDSLEDKSPRPLLRLFALFNEKSKARNTILENWRYFGLDFRLAQKQMASILDDDLRDEMFYSSHQIAIQKKARELAVQNRALFEHFSGQEAISKAVQLLALPLYKEVMPPNPSYKTKDSTTRTSLKQKLDHNARLEKVKKKELPARDIHDCMHATRAALWSQLLRLLYIKLSVQIQGNPVHLALTAALHDAAREDDGDEFWEDESAELVSIQLRAIGVDDQALLEHYRRAVSEKDYPICNTTQAIIHDADCLDIMRVIPLVAFQRDRLYIYRERPKDREYLDAIIKEIAEVITLTDTPEVKTFMEHRSTDLFGDLVRFLFLIHEKQPEKFKNITELLHPEMQGILKTKANDATAWLLTRWAALHN